jgi:spore photoproduct lyase
VNSFNLDKIYIDEASKDSAVVQRILNVFPKDQISWVNGDFMSDQKGTLSKEQFEWSKRNVLVTPFKGHFFKRCPGASQKTALTCCNYYVLNLGSQCNLNCSYCYLQSYLNTPVMKIYSNIDTAKAELLDMMKTFPQHPYRVGTGEIIDSLSMDELTLYSRELIPLFKEFPHWTLEFKTKSDRVDQFLDLGPAENVHVSWSINPPHIINSEEHGTARFEQRLAAAKKVVAAGFKLAFHVDPIIYHPEWKENYTYLVDEITKNFSPNDVKVVSLGTLRFQPEQRLMMRERFGMDSLVNQAEMFTSDSGKMRYDWHLRTQMFQFVLNRFKNNNPAWNIFLCMETPETWATTLNKSPMKVEGLENLFRPLPKVKSESNESVSNTNY